LDDTSSFEVDRELLRDMMRSGMKISCARKIEEDPRSVDLLCAMHDRFGKTRIAWEAHACTEAEFEINFRRHVDRGDI